MKRKIQASIAAVPAPSNRQPPAAVHAGCDDAAGAKAYQGAMLEALCQGIVEEMQQNAEVLVKSVAGVTPGGGKSGPGTGDDHMMDLRTSYEHEHQRFDSALAGADLATEEGLTTAVLLSLFTDARAQDSDALPAGEDRRGLTSMYNRMGLSDAIPTP